MSASRLSPLNPDDIARRVGRSGMRVRKLLRAMYPEQAPGSGGRWMLTEEQVAEVLAYFESGRLPPPSAARPPSRVSAPAFRADGTPTDWYWEGHVQAALIAYLVRTGWQIDRTSDTARREQGPDVVASRPGRRLLVEVKGYPSTGYRDPRRAGEVKPTNPTLQAKHWFSDALLKAIRMQHSAPGAEVALCFPRAARYQALIDETESALRCLGIGLFLVDESGSVEVFTNPRPAPEGPE